MNIACQMLRVPPTALPDEISTVHPMDLCGLIVKDVGAVSRGYSHGCSAGVGLVPRERPGAAKTQAAPFRAGLP